jgi:hypothetical protein
VLAKSSFRLFPSKISIARSSPSVTGTGSGRSSTDRRSEPIGSVGLIDWPVLVAPVSAPDGSRSGGRAWLARAAGEPLDLHFTWHVRAPAPPTAYDIEGWPPTAQGNFSPPALARSPGRSGIAAALPDDTPRLPRDRGAVKREIAKTLYN